VVEVKYVHIRNRKLIAQSVEENAYAYMVEGEEVAKIAKEPDSANIQSVEDDVRNVVA
jgi:hypothetical protein